MHWVSVPGTPHPEGSRAPGADGALDGLVHRSGDRPCFAFLVFDRSEPFAGDTGNGVCRWFV